MKKKTPDMVLQVVLFLCSLLVIVPLLMLLLGTVKNEREAAQFSIMLPTEWHFENFVHVIHEGNLLRAFRNSVLYTVPVLLLTSLAGMLCAYVIARRQTRYTSFLYCFFTVGMIAPLMIIPTVVLLKTMRMYGSLLGVILVYAGMYMPWSVFLITGFVRTVPREMDEAAIVDGCGPLRAFIKVIMPLLLPILSTNLIFVGMSVWNGVQIPLYLINSPTLTPLPMAVYNFYGTYYSSWNYVFATLVLSSLPIVVLYVFCQRQIIDGMTAGAVKG